MWTPPLPSPLPPPPFRPSEISLRRKPIKKMIRNTTKNRSAKQKQGSKGKGKKAKIGSKTKYAKKTEKRSEIKDWRRKPGRHGELQHF